MDKVNERIKQLQDLVDNEKAKAKAIDDNADKIQKVIQKIYDSVHHLGRSVNPNLLSKMDIEPLIDKILTSSDYLLPPDWSVNPYSVDIKSFALGGGPADFKREERYLVFKLSDMDEYLRPSAREPIFEAMAAINRQRNNEDLLVRNYAVVQDNWPEYEKVWDMIEQRVTRGSS